MREYDDMRRTGNQRNALLVELLIVVLFFMLAATVLLRVFSTARNMSEQSRWITEALSDAQNVAERLLASDAPEAELTHMGFGLQEGAWVLAEEGYVISVTLSAEETSSGVMRRQEVTVLREGQQLLALPGARYEEARP